MMEAKSEGPSEIKVYKWRYTILFTIFLLNISNAAMWISYSPVATTIANFYKVTPEKVNWFSMVFLIAAIPFCFISTFVVNKWGLKFGIYLGAFLNCGGAIIRALGSSGIFTDPTMATQYGVSLTGQTISAMAQSFLLFIPTKVSQLWFPESQRAISTTILAMSSPCGILIAQAVTPVIVAANEQNVPLNNYVWMGVALLSLVCTFIFIRSGKPKTPPSLSAITGEENRTPYFQQLRQAFTSVPYLFLFVTLGAGIAAFTTVTSLTQQLLCPLGYSDVFGGTINVVMILMGFLGSGLMGVMVDKTKLFGEVTKAAFGVSALLFIFLLEFYLLPNQNAVLLTFCGLFGFFSVGVYPIGLELSVEITFPVEETISTAFIFLSGQVQGIIAIAVIPVLATNQDPSLAYLNNCNSEEALSYKNYSVPLMLIMTYMTLVSCAMILFMKLKYKRMEAERAWTKHSEEDDDSNPILVAPNTPDSSSIRL